MALIGSSVPGPRRQNQIWVFSFMETPDWSQDMRINLTEDQKIYNWTLTYRHDSDVPAFYGRVVRKSRKGNERYTNDNNPSTISQTNVKVESKKKLIAWIASRCWTSSKREHFVAQLKLFIPDIDIYGECGQLQCSTSRSDAGGVKTINCYEELRGKYKFYLALENAICIDYITEKFFLALTNDMVPIVYGGGDYESIAPPKSFINVNSFKSVQALATYLIYLDDHPSEYAKYFEWKKHYDVQLFSKKWCDLCQKLWSVSDIDDDGQRIISPHYQKSYKNISDWWFHIPQRRKQRRHSSGKFINETDNLLACSSKPFFSAADVGGGIVAI